jgi:hypothetical protein
MIRDRRRFLLGAAGLAVFAVSLALWGLPFREGPSGLERADRFFNRLAKHSAHRFSDQRKEAGEFLETRFEAACVLKEAEDAPRLARVLASGGIETEVHGATVRLRGYLGRAAAAAIDDAELLYCGEEQTLAGKYGFSGREAVYWWWTAFGAVYRRQVEERRIEESNFASAIRTKVCEPAYNFAGFEPVSAAESAAPLAGILVFYVLYTVWYGFSIFFLFEGLGIRARKHKKEET